MHVTAVLALGAGAFKYVLPTSDTSCVVTHRILLVQLLLYDVSAAHLLPLMGIMGSADKASEGTKKTEFE